MVEQTPGAEPAVEVTVGVLVAVGVLIAVPVLVGVGVSVDVGVEVKVDVDVGVAVGGTQVANEEVLRGFGVPVVKSAKLSSVS